MTEKQKRFADAYLADCNIAKAYMTAYPKVRSVVVASTNGGRLLKKAEIKSYLDEQLEKLHTEKLAEAQEVLEYLTAVLRGQARSEIVVVVGAGRGVTETRTITKRPDGRERLKAAEILLRYYGISRTTVEDAGGVIVLPEIGEGES